VNFANGTTELDLKQFAELYGQVDHVRIVRNHDITSKDFGFIYMATVEDALKVSYSLCILYGKYVFVINQLFCLDGKDAAV